MLNRRIIVLFILFVVGFGILAIRLGQLQLAQGDHWEEEMRLAMQYPMVIETARGAILDRKGNRIAYDKATYHLAMDYRAMNYDDRWLARAAIDRLKDEKFARRSDRSKRIAEVKDQIKREIDAIPAAVAQRCGISEEEVLTRFQLIRQKIRDLRTQVWNAAHREAAATQRGDPDSGMARDPDAEFRRLLKDETITHTIVEHITDEQANDFLTHAGQFPGLVVVDSRTRVYPYRSAACQVVGSLRRVDVSDFGPKRKDAFRFPDLRSPNDQGNLGGYRATDLIGADGMERFLEKDLHGTLGCRIIELSAPGEDTAPATDDEAAAPPDRSTPRVFGRDVRLTLDMDLQAALENAILDPARRLTYGDDGKEHFIALVVLALNGEVLAIISTPGFDPNEIDQIRADLVQDEYRRPLSNRALQAYTPGSTVKPLLAAAALTERLIVPETAYTCHGVLFPGRDIFRCDNRSGHGPLALVDALTYSCNIYFYTVGQRLRIDRLATWYGNFGLGQDSGFELPDSDGLIPKPRPNLDADVANHDAILFGIGQGPVMITPLQMANAYATLLRGGEFIQPRIMADAPPVCRQLCTISPAHLATVRQGMQRVTTVGTAKSVFRNFRLPTGGKTGTATTFRPAFDDQGNPVFDPDKPLKNHDGTPKLDADGQPMFGRASERGVDAWYVGYAPADRPKFVVAAVMEFGGHGGHYAAPLVKEAFVQLQKHRYLPDEDLR